MSEQWQKPIGIEPAIFPADQAPEPVAWRYRYNEHSEWKYTNTPVDGMVPYRYWQEPLYAAPPALSSEVKRLREENEEVKKERDALRTSTDELRRAIADLIGADPETWPDHGNAPLAIAAGFALAQNRADKAEAALAKIESICTACVNRSGHIVTVLNNIEATIRGAKE